MRKVWGFVLFWDTLSHLIVTINFGDIRGKETGTQRF